jgi:hypothetical protein
MSSASHGMKMSKRSSPNAYTVEDLLAGHNSLVQELVMRLRELLR